MQVPRRLTICFVDDRELIGCCTVISSPCCNSGSRRALCILPQEPLDEQGRCWLSGGWMIRAVEFELEHAGECGTKVSALRRSDRIDRIGVLQNLKVFDPTFASSSQDRG